MTPSRVATIDIGTNTVLLLIAEGPAESPTAVLEQATITRLGQGVDQSRKLHPDAIERTTQCLAKYERLLSEHGAQAVDVVCTSAARDAENGDEFIARAESALGVRPRIIGGDEEARLTFVGAVSGLPLSGEVTVFDVGGGSTEIIRGAVAGGERTIAHAVSLDVGSVRLTERHVRTDPPRIEELGRIRDDVRLQLSKLQRPGPSTVIGVAGTVTTLASLAQSLPVYDSSRVHGSRLSKERISQLATTLSTVALSERRKLSGLEPARADVIVAGTVLVLTLLDWMGASEIVVSDRGVRWGLAERALRSLRR